MDRIRELGDAGVPFRFDVHALLSSDDAVALETLAPSRARPVRAIMAAMTSIDGGGRVWQIAADVAFPNSFLELNAVDGVPQFPQKLEPQLRFRTEKREIEPGVTVFVAPGDPTRIEGVEDDLRWSVAVVTLRMTSIEADASAACSAAMPYFERVLESLSFQMQSPLPMHSVAAIDLTGNPAVGDLREFMQWSGLPTPTFRRLSSPMGSVLGATVPDLSLDLNPADLRANRALDWYLKSLHAQFEADAFLFLWIAMEILFDLSDLKVEEPYTGPHCGHVIAHCQQCGAETTKEVRGASIKRFLTEGFSLDPTIAKRLWTARQMFHGAHAFDSKVMDGLPELSQWLRAVVVTILKPILGMANDVPPLAGPPSMWIQPYAGAGGERHVAPEDLDPLLGHEPV